MIHLINLNTLAPANKNVLRYKIVKNSEFKSKPQQKIYNDISIISHFGIVAFMRNLLEILMRFYRTTFI